MTSEGECFVKIVLSGETEFVTAGSFLLGADEAEAIFSRIVDTVRASWRETMRRVGVSARDCEVIRSAFFMTVCFSRRDLRMFAGNADYRSASQSASAGEVRSVSFGIVTVPLSAP